MIKEVTQTHLGSIWYPLKPSDVPCTTNTKLVENFCVSMIYVVKFDGEENFPTIKQKSLEIGTLGF